MIALIGAGVWLAALVIGGVIVLSTRKEERRWAAVGSLSVALVATASIGFAQSWGARPLAIGPFWIDAVPTTVGPAMLLGAIVLLLLSGRADASGAQPAWLLATLALESVALLSGSFALVLFAEAAASGLLAVHASRHGHRAHVAYLGVAAAALVAAGAGRVAAPDILEEVAVGLAVFAALVRLGILPFSTGMLASLRRGPTAATLLASLPFGGVVLLIRSNAVLSESGTATGAIVAVLLVAAPLSAALAISQRNLGRSLGYMLSATHALIALGVLDPSSNGVLGGELLWAAAILTATGFCAAANLVFLRIGSPDLDQHHGLHTNAPFLSLAFLVLGVGLAGAPGTVEFVAEDILLNTAVGEGLVGMTLVVVTIALIGFNVLRLQFRLFFGVSRPYRAYLATKPRERLGLVLVGATVVLGGVAPSVLPLVWAAASAAA
ncbi:MAG: NADH:ubiquinone oxidoreductase subunit 2 (subunit N), partial [bacterium]